MLQEASPTKYQSSGIVSPFQENVYLKAHKDKVKQLQDHVGKFAAKHDILLPSEVSPVRQRGQEREDKHLLDKGFIPRVESKGLMDMFNKADKRLDGAKLIQRQMEVDNLRDLASKQLKTERLKQKNLEKEQKVNSYLELIDRQKSMAEMHKEDIKRKQRRLNLEYGL